MDEEACNEACGALSEFSIIGLDTETVVYYQPGVANPKGAYTVQLCGGDEICYIFRVNLWEKLYPSFLSLLRNEKVIKVASVIGHDVRHLKERFKILTDDDFIEMKSLQDPEFFGTISRPGEKLNLESLCANYLGKRIDKACADHTQWGAEILSSTNLIYAATDAHAHRLLAQAALKIHSDDPDYVNRMDEDLPDVEHLMRGHQEASTRHKRSRSSAAGIRQPADLENANVGRGGRDGGIDSDSDEDDDSNPDYSCFPDLKDSKSGDVLLKRCLERLDKFAANQSGQQSLEMPPGLTKDQRGILHQRAESLRLMHSSFGEEAHRVLVVHRYKPFEKVKPTIGKKAEGAIVGKRVDNGEGLVLGRVELFRVDSFQFEIQYTDTSWETINDLKVLNQRLELAWKHFYGQISKNDQAAKAVGPATAASFGGLEGDGMYDKFVAQIRPGWEKGILKYDTRHFLGNWACMVAANKGSPLFGLFMSWSSDALYKVLPGEHDRVKRHLQAMNLSTLEIKRTKRRVWKRLCRYSCPGPEMIIRGLLDIYLFFKDMEDPLRPGCSFFTSDAHQIFEKEMAYVCKGFLSDKPGMEMYVRRDVASTGLQRYRCIRSSSALEGYFLHLRLAQNAQAKGAGLRFENARGNLFDYAWTVRAAVVAGKMPDVGHCQLWMVDALYDVCCAHTKGNKTTWPPFLKSWSKVDTTVDPTTFRGINFDALVRDGADDNDGGQDAAGEKFRVHRSLPNGVCAACGLCHTLDATSRSFCCSSG